ncbi:MAG: CDP-alcohol phosphatidyltransferase family protein [Gemmataceae bacterium]
MKKIAVVPTLLTLGNGICGFVAIAFASKINLADAALDNDYLFGAAGWFILAAMLFDMLDGYVARLAKSATKFGAELDSLCDAISFGIVPAFLLLKMGPGWEPRPWLHQLLAGIAALYMCCAILRLARYNVADMTNPDPASQKRFRGLPSPGAAGCIASLAILRGDLPNKIMQFFPELDKEAVHHAVYRFVEVFSPIGALIVGLLMVSLVPFPHLAKQMLRGKKHVGHLIQLLLGAFIILMFRELALALVFWGYALAFPVRYLIVRALRPKAPPTPDTTPRQTI